MNSKGEVAILSKVKRFDFVLSGLALGLYAGRVLLELFRPPVSTLLASLVTLVTILGAIALTAIGHRHRIALTPLLALYFYVFWPWLSPVLALSNAVVVVVALVRDNILSSLRKGGRLKTFSWLNDVLLFVASFALYVHTLAPTILPADSGEFQFVAYVLGIAHPPGYPLYTMLAKLWTYFPWGDIAYRVNLFSAFTSALTLVVLSKAVRRITGSAVAGWIGAAVLGTIPTFWVQSTTANIRSLTALFIALQFDALLAYAGTKGARHLITFALVFGLGITHHGSIALLALPYAVFILASDPQLVRKPRVLLKPLLIFLLSLLVLLYLPLRSALGAPFDPQPIRSWAGFLDHVLARGFRGDMFYFIQPRILLARSRVLLNILALEFGPVLLLLGALGAVSMLKRHGKLLLLCGGVFAVNALTAITYRAPQTVEYMIPAYVALAFICAYGAWSLAKFLGPYRLSSLVLAAALLLPASTLLHNYPSFAQLSKDRSARQYAEAVLQQAPRGARILSNWHYATPLWYLQYVEHVRPDVEVVYVYPEGAAPMARVWLRRIEESAAHRPTIVTNYYLEFEAAPYTFQPFAGAWLVQTGPVYQVPSDIKPLDVLFDDRIRFAGYVLQNRSVSPADSLRVRIYWQPATKLDRDYSFFVHLVDESGAVLGQGDITHPAARYEVGQVIVDEYHIPLLPTVRSGRYKLVAGVYITLAEGGWRRLITEEGNDTVTLCEVEVQPLDVAPVTRHSMYRPFACGYTLLGVDYDRSLRDQLRLYLHWRCDMPSVEEQDIVLFSGSTVLVASHLPAGQMGKYFTTAHDLPAAATDLELELRAADGETTSPLLGPWKRPIGHRVVLPAPSANDRYICLGGEILLVKVKYPATISAGSLLRAEMTFVGIKPITHDYSVSLSLAGETGMWRVQHDGTPALGAIPTLKWIRGTIVRDEHHLLLPQDAAGQGLLQLTVYDAFTMRPLPVLDERLARLGQGTQIKLGDVEIR